jgi:ribosomal protein S18 acetylase RimI-like enzyme
MICRLQASHPNVKPAAPASGLPPGPSIICVDRVNAAQEILSMSSGVEIRPYASDDHPQVVALWKAVFPDDPPWNEPASMIRRKLTVQPELFLVGHVNGRIVAAVMAGFDGVRGWIHHLAVHAEYRRKGIATILMRAAEQGLEALGCPKVNLQVRATNTAVISFYRSLGYDVEERASLGKRLGAA